jgi:hypothetical protein
MPLMAFGINPFLPTWHKLFWRKKWDFPAGTLLQDSFHYRYFRNHALLMLVQEHIYSANTQVDTYSRTMLDGKSAQSESSESADGSDSEPSQQDFDASVLGSIVPSDASHLGSISCSMFRQTMLRIVMPYRNDRDSANYSTTICTNCYYIQIFCWALDRFIHAVYVIVCNLSKTGMGPTQWKAYESKNIGHHDFQIDLAIDLMKYGIRVEWDGNSKARPSFMPKSSLVPCDCNKCFFWWMAWQTGLHIGHHYTSAIKESKGNCGVQVCNLGDNKQMQEDKESGKSGTEIRKILLDVLLKADNHGFTLSSESK